jgi:CubicO group peptidase (beta-lactamase class C family)
VPGFAWSVDPQGYQLGYRNIKITAADMVKLGELYLNGGQWQGAQLVPAAWVAESTRSQLRPEDRLAAGYGYQWWLGDAAGHPAFAAMGYAGQLIDVVPDLKLVVAVSCLDGPASFDSADLAALVSRHIVPAVTG